MNTPIFVEEMELLTAQIAKVEGRLQVLRDQLQAVEAELEVHAGDRQRFAALQEVCAALDRLGELDGGALFWDELVDVGEGAHLDRLRGRIAGFEAQIHDNLERQQGLKAQIVEVLGELDQLDTEVYDAQAREERRRDEFIVEREVSAVPIRAVIMPWTTRGEGERYFYKSLLIALLLSLFFGGLMPLISVPIPDRATVVAEIPERLAMLVKKEPPLPEPVPKPVKEEKKPEPEKAEKTAKADQKPKPKQTAAKTQTQPKAGPTGTETRLARQKAEQTGVLAFKSSFKDLMDEVPVAKLGTEARLSKQAPRAAGQARAQRSLVAMQAKGGGSGGIGNYRVSRNLGSGRGSGGEGTAEQIGGLGYSEVDSAVAGIAESDRPLSDGVGPSRTDEEIQIVFDRYKATLYRIYNKQLRKDPTLRGKMLLRLTIEPDGSVSQCKVEATDLKSDELVAQILARVERFNFGPKEDVPQLTILYPIDFLPAS